jgi:hypothetical protein
MREINRLKENADAKQKSHESIVDGRLDRYLTNMPATDREF